MSAISGITSSNSTATNATSAAAAATGTDALANTQTFMTLLVAQLKNQDPTQPQDGMQFVTQLAQFSNLEQSVAMRSDISSIKGKYVDGTATTASTPTTPTA